MGLALAIIFGFFVVIGVSPQKTVENNHHQVFKKTQTQIKKKAVKKLKAKPQISLALLDGVPVRNLQG